MSKVFAALGLIAMLALPAVGQVSEAELENSVMGDPLRIKIEQVGSRTPVAVPLFAATPGAESYVQELTDAIKYDLGFTGMFYLLNTQDMPVGSQVCPPDPSQINFSAWRGTKAEFLVYGRIFIEGGSVVGEFRLFDIASGEQFIGKRLEGTLEWKRLIAHKFADEILLYLTGDLGVATTQIVYSGGATGSKELYIADYDGANARKLTQHNSISILPAVSPDGSKIAYMSYKDRFPFLYILDVRSGASSPLSKHSGLNTSPSWSPDGSRLACVLSKDANEEIYVTNPDGSNKRRLTNNNDLDTSPTWSADGSRIAFVHGSSSPQIYVMGADGGGMQRISLQGGKSYDPSWSPDGKSIAFVVEERGQGMEIYVMNADGSNARRMTNSSGNNEAPSWSPDSRHVVFATSRAGGSQLWTVNVDTGDERPVPNIAGRVQGPSWGPRRN